MAGPWPSSISSWTGADGFPPMRTSPNGARSMMNRIKREGFVLLEAEIDARGELVAIRVREGLDLNQHAREVAYAVDTVEWRDGKLTVLDPDEKALIKAANKGGGEDNITVVLFQMSAGREAEAAPGGGPRARRWVEQRPAVTGILVRRHREHAARSGISRRQPGLPVRADLQVSQPDPGRGVRDQTSEGEGLAVGGAVGRARHLRRDPRVAVSVEAPYTVVGNGVRTARTARARPPGPQWH